MFVARHDPEPKVETRTPPPPSHVVERVIRHVIAMGKWIDFGYFDREIFDWIVDSFS